MAVGWIVAVLLGTEVFVVVAVILVLVGALVRSLSFWVDKSVPLMGVSGVGVCDNAVGMNVFGLIAVFVKNAVDSGSSVFHAVGDGVGVIGGKMLGEK